ncbi:unnamed protein product [Camellia sinensis]
MSTIIYQDGFDDALSCLCICLSFSKLIASGLGKRGSTAVTAILIDFQKLVVANVGDSRAVVCKNGVAKQLSVDHEPRKERTYIEDRGGFVSNFPVLFHFVLGSGSLEESQVASMMGLQK